MNDNSLVSREAVLSLIAEHSRSARRISKERLERGETASADIACGVMIKLEALYKLICIMPETKVGTGESEA